MHRHNLRIITSAAQVVGRPALPPSDFAPGAESSGAQCTRRAFNNLYWAVVFGSAAAPTFWFESGPLCGDVLDSAVYRAAEYSTVAAYGATEWSPETLREYFCG